MSQLLLKLMVVFCWNLFSTSNCYSIKVGESVSFSGMNSKGTSISANYKLERDQANPNLFKVFLNPHYNFPGVKVSDKRQRVHLGGWMDWRIRTCLKFANQYFRNSLGQRIQVQISREPTVPPVHISVFGKTKKGFRASHKRLSIHSPCHIVVHELLHSLGLMDEYEETQIGHYVNPSNEVVSYSRELDDSLTFKPKFDCRVVGAKSSIMRDPLRAYELARKNNRSLLSPSQFNFIVSSRSSASSFAYQQCAKNANRTSYGTESNPWLKGPCLPVPKFCDRAFGDPAL